MIKTEPLEAVSIADAALDVEAMSGRLGDYAVTRDITLVREVPGMKATRFWIEDIPSSLMWAYVLEPPEQSPLRLYRAFQYGVRRIENFVRKNGAPVAFMTPEGTGGTQPAYWTDDQMAQLPPVYVAEMGGLAFHRSFFADARPQGWPLSPTSHAALAHRMYLLADKIRNESTPDSVAPSGSEDTPSA